MFFEIFLRVPDATRENVIEKVTGGGAISYRTINNAGPRAIKLDTQRPNQVLRSLTALY